MFTITDELFDNEIGEAVFEDLKEKLMAKQSNHCLRVDYLAEDIMAVTCHRINSDPELRSHLVEAFVLTPKATEPYHIESGSLIEKRNRLSFGVLVVFIPQGFRGAAEDSYDIHTFESYNLAGVLQQHKSRMLDLLPEQNRKAAKQLLNHDAVRKLPIENHIRYLLALRSDGSDWEELGAYLFHLDLIPDLQLVEQHLEGRIDRNRKCVESLSNPDNTVFLSLESLINEYGLDADYNGLRGNLLQFFQDYNDHEVSKWTKAVLTDKDYHGKLTFDKWKFKDLAGEQIELYLAPFENPRTGEPIPGLMKEGDNLLASTDTPIQFKWETNPTRTDEVSQFLVLVEKEDAGEGSTDELTRKNSKGSVRKMKLSLKDIDLDEGVEVLVRLRILAKDKAGVVIAQDESEPFYIRGGEIIPAETKKFNRIRNRAEAIFIATYKYRTLIEIDNEGWESGKANLYRIKVRTKDRDTFKILINPLLFEIEQKNLIDPLNLGAWSADLTNQSFLEISQLKPVSVSATIPMCNTFVEMRRELFQKITDHSEGSVVEVLDLREFKKEILAYSSAYLSMLKGIREKLTSTTTDSGINNILSQNGKIQRIDTVHITLGSNDSTDEVVLLAPTHPLRMLWILQYQELLYSWGSKLVGLTDDQARAAISLESLKEITSLNIPSALSFANKEFYVNSDNIDLYWSILPKSTTRDIRKVVTQLMRSLGFKNQQEEITSIGPEAIADRIWRYLKHHPYVTTLKLNVINPGDGNVVLNTIRHLQRMDDFKDLHYDIAFYGDLGHELMGSAFDDIMDEGGSSEFGVSDIDEELLIPNNNPLFPKLFFSKIRLTDDEWLRKEIREAHISIVIDRFSTRTFTRKQLHERGSFFLHNILAEYRSDFSVEKESATWSRKVIPNPNIEMIDGEITASLIYSIVDNFLRFSCCLHDADASFEKLPAIQLELSDVDKHIINSIHEKSDWVFTIDRNFGIEYFDNPINSKKSVKSYLIDYTPEFIDGVGHRLIVSTYWLLEIEALIGNALKQIGVPASGYQATRILDIIKSISGKLALKLINNPNNVKEIIGLALTKLFLEKSGRLNDAIIIPVDSHIDLFAEYKRGGDEELSLSRSDLLLIQAKGNTLHWALIEVKFRTVGTNLAEILNLKEAIVLKNENTQKVITKRFGENPSSVRIDKPLTNKSLSNLINFYLERALRHSLDGKQQHQLEGLAHILEKIESDRFEMDFSKEGFILSWAGASRPVDNYKGNDIHIIGRREIALLLDIGEAQTIENEQVVLPVDEASVESGKPVAAVGRKRREVGKGRPQSGPATVPLEYLPQSSVPQVSVKVEETTSARRIFLGKDCDSGKPMYWDPFTLVPKKLANQHILIVGKPGSGKSQSASSFMYELEKNNVPFIVFDFQGEYITPDHTNGSAISFVNLTKSKILDAAEGIELNPLEVPVDLFTGQKQSFTKTVYQVSSTLNKIFGLGEIQYSILRRAINQAFIECGFSVTDKSTWSGRAPSLEQVWKILQHIEKTEGGSSRNLILRIQPLFDTGVFRDQDSQSSFSELFKQNTIVRLSSLPTVELMVSVSRFVLQKIYNEMLTLGPTKDLRMFVVIDEAHKLSYDETLTELIREARKYGVGIMLASQSVRDFDLVVFDAVGTKICLQLEGDNAKIMADNFGLVDAQQRKQIHQMILNQKSGTALIRNNHFEPFRQIDLEQFWQKL